MNARKLQSAPKEQPMLRIGIPAGSLANAQRGGNLFDLLATSGFRTSGHDKGGPTKFVTVNSLFGWDGRPQEFGSQLETGELDVAIAGDDWVRERALEMQIEHGTTIALERVMTLNRGEVRLVGIVADRGIDSTEQYLRQLAATKKPLITVAAEMPYIALDWVRSRLAAAGIKGYRAFSVQKYRTPPRIKKGIVVYESWGKTESKVKHGAVDLGLEITQTGSAIANYGLKIIETVMQSEAAIWINPAIRKSKPKRELLEMFLVNIYGAVHAENKVMLIFNVPNSLAPDVEQYLSGNNLFGDEPTVNRGKAFTEYNIQVNTDDPEKPVAMIRYKLAKFGARSINTLPVSSSIPSIKVIA
jgi:ATP phosphoribosyltransferase